ncbi:MAG: Malto-oligosyltrehalose trehalohydrolase [Devosia sp.]|nr:Malto-oligosyltrehalose trehalohydrolase [Devosia sp.]
MDQLTSPARPTIRREQEMKFGTQITASGVRFRLWAPQCQTVGLKIIGAGTLPMQATERGWFELEVPGAGAGTRYLFVIDGELEVPDPASRFQPEDVDGPSEVVDPLAYEWRDRGWRGRPWEETVFYQLHIGTFTEQGTFLSTIDKLDYLVDLGITAIQLLPLGDFKGRWNWGYDGAMLFAPDSSYGRPEDLKALVDAAHARGLMIFLDVIYNHFGPKGNYLPAYAPVMTEKHKTPWGAALNYDDEGSPTVRDLVFANVRFWLNEYRFDGLRLDAVHAIEDSGPKHLLQELAEQTRAATDGRYIHLVQENSKNQARWFRRQADGTTRLYDAQWNDDVHHCLHVAATGESFWYYENYAGRTELLGRSLAEGYAYQGEVTPHEGEPKGEPSGFLPSTAFVAFIQNHDQIGNRPFGERIGQLVPAAVTRVLAAIYLLSPQIPMVFMGEEWDSKRPFLFFTDVGEDLAEAIRKGRREEMRHMIGDSEPDRLPPDPMAEETFRACKLDWSEPDEAQTGSHLALYRSLLALRNQEIVPRLRGLQGHAGRYEILGDKAVRVSWTLGDGSSLVLSANLGSEPVGGLDLDAHPHLWVEGRAGGDTLQPWSAVFDLHAAPGQGTSAG